MLFQWSTGNPKGKYSFSMKIDDFHGRLYWDHDRQVCTSAILSKTEVREDELGYMGLMVFVVEFSIVPTAASCCSTKSALRVLMLVNRMIVTPQVL